MKQKILSTIILFLILFVLFFIIFLKLYNEKKQNINTTIETYQTICGKYARGEIKIDSKNLSVGIADDNCKQNLGLSGKISLADDTGMFFVFKMPGNYGFWMKDMNFPLDIVWMDDNFGIIGIEKALATSTYPNIYGKKYFAKYVLEIPAGYSDKNNIKIGDKILLIE